ncbi:choline/carnitine O-acyltransferase [Mobilicoccus pelagius]|uniref:Putative acyltransferase n=1 Tax=Mobilicoccus pelagius NBRC 104925 TaxID=1089455 RepID=H5UTA1_9MICO|nr:choline/carnitine O-acyltransferase [Mobilicoccus pelagius]GAB48959.1 putative acyltransferase [Mobilicoccus pelagius NBRC 104925]
MTYLPLPPLEQTLARYQEIVAPLLSEEEAARTTEVVAEFAAHDGPRAQEDLARRAEKADGDGASWLTDLWYASYLTTRTPLPLTSNVGFGLTWPTDDHGLDRAARLAHRFARVHLHHVRGEIDPQTSPRGAALCMQQWRYLAGGMRRPRPECDELLRGCEDAASREIVVLHRGRGYAVQVSDDAGRVVPLDMLREALRSVLDATGADDAPTTGWGPGEETPFPAWSYLGSDTAAHYEDEVLADADNAAVHARLTDALFVLSLLDDEADEDTHLRETGFRYGVAWPFKPVTYVVGLADPYTGMHVEHTVADGGTVQAVVGLAQDLPDDPDVPDEEEEIDESSTASGDDGTPAGTGVGRVEPLRWRLSDDVRARLAADVAAYAEDEARLRVRVLRTPIVETGGRRMSADALQQFAILHAQLRTYGRVRSTYESVDMREYQAGRTEAMRPVSPEAVALARALVDGDATAELLDAALAEHKRRIVECKKGEAVDRHLLGLRVSAAELGLSTAVFDDVAYARLTTDFLSTTSLGTDERIPRYVFAPTSEGGLGIEYGRRSTGEYEFLVIHGPERDADVEEFVDALRDGVARLADLVAYTD